LVTTAELGFGSYLGWLNRQLIETIDQLVARYPDVEIVLFSDHGGRFLESDKEEWHRTFLAARTPIRPGLFANSPHPGSIHHDGLRLLPRVEGEVGVVRRGLVLRAGEEAISSTRGRRSGAPNAFRRSSGHPS
jgi:hypothetical protein